MEKTLISQRFEGTEHEPQDSVTSQHDSLILDLSSTNPTNKGFEFPESMISHELESIPKFVYDPNPQGIESIRKTISEYYNSERKFNSNINDFIITSSTSESYSYLIKLFCNPGDDILIPSPGYPLIEDLARMEFVNSIFYPQNQSTIGWIEILKSKISFKTKILFLVSPSNPTGEEIDLSSWEELVKLCTEFNIVIVLDEVFHDYSSQIKEINFNNEFDTPVFILNGASKMLAMPQLKIAWIFSVGKLSQSKEIQQNLLWIADTYLSVSSFSQEFFIKIFPWRKMIQNQIKNRLSRNIHSINTSLRDQNNISCIDTKACWSVVLTYNGSKFSSGIEWSDYLFKNQNIKIYPGEFFHYQNGKHIILSLILEEQKVVLGMERIIQSIKS